MGHVIRTVLDKFKIESRAYLRGISVKKSHTQMPNRNGIGTIRKKFPPSALPLVG